jgi:hypothetical protein
LKYYFVVDKSTDLIQAIVQRNVQVSSDKKVVEASGVMMSFYFRLAETADDVTLADVMALVR